MAVAVKSPFQKRKTKKFENLSKGLNNKFAATLIEDEELADVQNFNFDEKGTLTQRKGYIKHYAANFATGGVRGLFNYRKENGQSILIMAADDKVFYDTPNFRVFYDAKSDWDTGTLDNVATDTPSGDITLSNADGAFGLIEFGAESAIFGGLVAGSRTGYWTSPPIDISSVTNKTTGVATDVNTIPGGTSRTIQTRTAAGSSMAGATGWVGLGAGSSIVSAGNNYLQVRVLLTSTTAANPSLQSLTISYDATPAVTQLLAGLDAVARFTFETQNDYLLFTNGVDVPKKWIGTGAAADIAGAPPTGKYIVVHKNRAFMFGNVANPSRLYFSDIGNFESWPALNFIDVGKGDGDKLTGGMVLFDMLVLTKDNTTYILQGDGPSTFVLRKATGESGAYNMSSLALIKSSVAMLSRDGVRIFDGLKSVLSSEKIQGTLNGLNPRQLALAASIVYLDKVYISVPEGSSLYNNAVLVFDTLRTAWTVYRGMNFGCFALWRRYNADTLMAGDSTQGMVYEMETGYNDAGVATDAYAVTKQAFGDAQAEAKLVRIAMFAMRELNNQPAIVDVSFRKDNGADSTPLSLATVAGLNVRRAIPSTVGVTLVRTLGVKVRHNELDKAVSITSIEFDYASKGVRETT